MGSHRWRLTAAGRFGAVLLVGLLTALPLVAGPASGADEPVTGPTVTVTPTRVVDGQSVTINVRTTPDQGVVRAEARLCRAGVDYATGTGLRPPLDVGTGGPNCPPTPVSTSADVSVINTNTAQTATTPDGESFFYRVGAGIVTWKDLNEVEQRLTCDEENPCALVVSLRVTTPSGQVWRPFVTTLSYAADDPFAGCGGPAQGVLGTAGSDRMTETWIAWTVEECSREGRTGAAGRATLVGEGLALGQFARATIDLAYTGGGFNEEIDLAEEPAPSGEGGEDGEAQQEEVPPTERPAVAVPVGVNAAVVAVAGGVRTATNKIPFRDLKLTSEEVAVLFGQGPDRLEPYLADILERNPELAEAGMFDLTAGFQVGAYAESEVSSWYLTRYLDELAPDDAWSVPDLELFGDDRGQPRGAHANMALADPSFANTLSTLSGRSSVIKGLATISPGTSGAVWLMTDLSTARALGLTVVQIENADGDFVAPTEVSMLAAVDHMHEDDAGILISDPDIVAEGSGAQPYPLTFVEYALAPTQPLLTVTCTPRQASQALLASWLEYVTGEGQDPLAPGMLPLTPELQATASERIPQVGKADVTGPCAASTTTTTAPGSVPTTPTTLASTNPDGGDEDPPAMSPAPSRAPSGSRATAPSGDNAITIVEEDDGDDDGGLIESIIPAFAGRAAVGWIGVFVALVLITAFHSAASAATARAQMERREPPPS